MPQSLIGRKIGMTRLYDSEGQNVPVTIIQAGPCHVAQIKQAQTDGYDAVQIGFEPIKPRNSTMPLIGHDAKAGLPAQRIHREFRLAPDETTQLELGQELTIEVFNDVPYVDVTGVSKGKGFAGVMKRWGFKGQPASHGTERKHRSPGSVGGRSTDLGGGRPKKGIRMGGHLGNQGVTVRSLPIIKCDEQRHLLVVKGPVPGANGGLVFIQAAKRLYKSKSAKAKES